MAQFQPIEPYETGLLDVGDGHQIYWECCGNPAGKPALFLHGGPGTGCSVGQRRFFDPDVYRAVLFDQRGSGRSLPLASQSGSNLASNTTAHLVADIERLRELLGVESWIILGLSWGTTLGLAYAQAHPRRVKAMVLGFVTTTSRAEVQWITKDVGRIFPREWERFSETVPRHLRDMPLVDAYAIMLADADETVRDRAARAWCEWEDAHVSLTPGHRPNPRFDDAEFRLRFARLVTHYWRHAAFLEEDQLIRDASRLNGIPGALIHGRFDVSGPLSTAWQLHKRWTTSRLHILEDAGHGGGNEFMPLVIRTLDEFGKL
ncbi:MULTISPECIES: prolyl aminopeptidase [Bradyrhizobium]|uniref:Proline iminopeptidase n=1 Tax=Bradyrhizobium diazoefficiens (strain JCM 10833 / BCRC 13528 / IAM 13628 / NBRC 14792 / USDA 110) TaxID=224911 RepID=Q89LZ0_BRADU|nr:prolyl aminopeptidase [Bradyrhizobium diazoefficiens]MBP1065579.1 proline iminopeptidase [Bradyrhizobium japonicum]AND89679.1 proline iminopeptidase [Bradyrhizobium diazoefficiens USDA 110]AWO91330.1 prolyl aminopeptidase [Bradyrhizobium diazoefficiens]PDT58745.1 prolyl aminopeptidase [Bradyrhizobium diazoefficiens]QLD43810.1 prolyl aminopeptidase [Bradyrhizobium diazoefficiens]